jgi:hypothetical protein
MNHRSQNPGSFILDLMKRMTVHSLDLRIYDPVIILEKNDRTTVHMMTESQIVGTYRGEGTEGWNIY